MNVYGDKITCDTDLTKILDSSVFLTSNPDTVPGNLCRNINNYLASKIETLHSLSDGNDSLMATAFLIDNKPQELDKARSTITNYENDSLLFKNTFSDIGLKIVEREIDELKELLNCLYEKLGSLYDEGVKADDTEFVNYKNVIDEAESRLSRVKSLYYSLPGSTVSSGSKLAEAKASRAADEDYEVPKTDYNELVCRNWYQALSVISGDSPEELGVDSRDKAIFDSALDCFKKHFEGKSPTPAEMQSYWDKLKSGTSEDFHFGDDERDRIYKVSNIISGLDDVMNGYSFKISIWAKCNGMSVDEEYFDDFIDQEKVNAPGYYKVALDKIKFNK